MLGYRKESKFKMAVPTLILSFLMAHPHMPGGTAGGMSRRHLHLLPAARAAFGYQRKYSYISRRPAFSGKAV